MSKKRPHRPEVSGADVSKAFARFLYVQRRYGRKIALAQYPQFRF